MGKLEYRIVRILSIVLIFGGVGGSSVAKVCDPSAIFLDRWVGFGFIMFMCGVILYIAGYYASISED